MPKWTRQAIKDLKRIGRPQAELIREKIAQLEADKESLANNVKWIAQAEMYRLRVNDYRVFYDEDGNIITVYRVRHRSEAYR